MRKLALALILLFAATAWPTTLTLQPSQYDSTIDSADGGVITYGTADNFFIGRLSGSINRLLVKFDLTTVPTTFTTATLYLYCYQDFTAGNGTWKVYRMNHTWTEASVCWKYYAGTSAWTADGAFEATDCDLTEIGSLAFTTPVAVNEWKAITLTPTTKATLDHTYGFMVKDDTETEPPAGATLTRFYSNNYVTDTTLCPKLVITYTAESSSNLLLLDDED
jgi:hypothetical protein